MTSHLETRPSTRTNDTRPVAPDAASPGAAKHRATAARPGLRARLHARLLEVTADGSDRGDVPGWVLVTIMSAGVVLAVWAAAETVLPQVFREAVTNVRR